jgi:hypothetical protein
MTQSGVKALNRRLRRLEERVVPANVPREMMITFVSGTGEVESTMLVELQSGGSGTNSELRGGPRHFARRRS